MEAYSTAITSNHQELSYSSVLVWPSAHMLRFYNSLLEIWWLPQPKLYRLQVKAEICFRIKRFIEESIAALDRIDKKFPPSRLFQSSTSQTLGGVITTIDAYQRDHEAKIVEIPWWRRIQKPKDIETFKDTLALAKRIHKLTLEAKELAETNDAYSKRLRNQLQNFRENLRNGLSIELSSRSVLNILDPSLDDLDSIDGMRISTLRLKIAQICQDPHHSNNVPRELHMICFIYALGTTFSQIDDDVLRSVQRSWLMERKEAINRYELMTGSDLDSQVDLGLKIYQAYKDGSPRSSDF